MSVEATITRCDDDRELAARPTRAAIDPALQTMRLAAIPRRSRSAIPGHYAVTLLVERNRRGT
ncbi:MAG: hypothetical protein E6614_26695 [Bradyrhizobium sp.]|uniref:hypothetical protein n=1 Tax=Bradyrhizobium TaxID=374 RepID=UPI0003AA0A4F|nr:MULTISPECIES: hypothetical protein [Bradyrhizobium]MCL8485549.1 hypothetical protein [Bradyrhizobium denitrificans]MDU6242500.1 hypothetical protein [Bradyrhizobium sp.]MDU6324524.1 hypothetical protein [Bradyrhizobium sp.]MDU6400136.1 hypothetical protein [Bradyrhizobium sp.]